MARRCTIAALATLCLLLAIPPAAGAAATSAQPPATPDPKPTFGRQDDDFGKVVAQSLGAVFLILLLGALAILVVKRLLPRIGVTQGRRIRVLETVYLGPRRSLHMVRIGDRILLIGGAHDGLSLLSDLTGFVSPDDADPAPRKPHTFVVPDLKSSDDPENP